MSKNVKSSGKVGNSSVMNIGWEDLCNKTGVIREAVQSAKTVILHLNDVRVLKHYPSVVGPDGKLKPAVLEIALDEKQVELGYKLDKYGFELVSSSDNVTYYPVVRKLPDNIWTYCPPFVVIKGSGDVFESDLKGKVISLECSVNTWMMKVQRAVEDGTTIEHTNCGWYFRILKLIK